MVEVAAPSKTDQAAVEGLYRGIAIGSLAADWRQSLDVHANNARRW
jgi:hypothetical protein